MDKLVLQNIDEGCIPTLSKYIKEQLIGAIFKYITTGNADSFTIDYGAREYIYKVSINDFKEALLEHIVKVDALFNIENNRCITEFSKDYQNHTVAETELRLFETINLSVDNVLSDHSIYEAYMIISKEQKALYNAIVSFVNERYLKANALMLDSAYLKSEKHKQMIWKIEEFFITLK